MRMFRFAFHVSALWWGRAAGELKNKGDSSPFFFFFFFEFFVFFFFAFLLPDKEEEEEEAMSSEFCRVPPLLCPRSGAEESVKGSDILQHQQKVEGLTSGGSCGCAVNFLLMAELRIKIMTFRDVLDLSPCNGSTPMNKLLMGTVGDLHKLYPKFVSCPATSEMISTSTYQGLLHFYEALKSVGDSWSETHKWCDKFSNEKDGVIQELSLEQLGEIVLERLGYLNEVAETFDLMDEEDQKNACIVENSPDYTFRNLLKNSQSVNKASYCESPHTPTSVLPDITCPISLNIVEFPNVSYSPPLLLPLRLKVMGKLKPIDVKRRSFHMFPHVSIENLSPMYRINKAFDASEPDNCETSSNSQAFLMDVTIASENSMIQMDETPKGLNPVSCDVTSEKVDDDNESTLAQPSELPPPMLLPKKSAFPPQPQSATPPQPLAKQSAPPLQPPPPPKLLPKQSLAPPPTPPTPPPKQYAWSPLSPLPMLPPKESTLSPPPPPMLQSIGSAVPSLPPPPLLVPPKESAFPPLPPPPMTLSEGLGPPPPPSLGVNKALRPKKANTKLKRSTQMGSLYRLLKGKVEGSNLSSKLSHGRKSQVGGSADNKAQGMADALAEITKRSAYFRQIEEDVQKHATSITEMKSAINSFQTKDMAELHKFHQYVELHLETLTDETQVLARFEDFPTKKLETIRTAAALYTKLDGIATNLESWTIEVPLARQLEKVECYFSKIKEEVDAIERSKDEEAKRFRNHKIEFDFSVLFRIKEFMVDVSSNCIEMSLKESKGAKEDADREGRTKHTARLKACSQTLWKAFQLAFRIYNFAGGQDDRADKLTSELAQEIETFSNHY